VFDLATTMSKFLHLGLSLDEVVAMTTAAPALVIGHDRALGTLRPGAAADVTLMTLQEGPVTFEDTVGEQLEGTRRLVPAGAVRAGRWVPPKTAAQ